MIRNVAAFSRMDSDGSIVQALDSDRPFCVVMLVPSALLAAFVFSIGEGPLAN